MNGNNEPKFSARFVVVQSNLAKDLQPCTLICNKCKSNDSEFAGEENQDFFAHVDDYYSVLILKRGSIFQVGFRPGDWAIVQKRYEVGSTFAAELYPMGRGGLETSFYAKQNNQNNVSKTKLHPKLAKLEEQFKLVDLDQTGKIDQIGFQTILSSAGMNLTREEARDCFSAIDSHGLGYIYFEDCLDAAELETSPECVKIFLRELGIESKRDCASHDDIPLRSHDDSGSEDNNLGEMVRAESHTREGENQQSDYFRSREQIEESEDDTEAIEMDLEDLKHYLNLLVERQTKELQLKLSRSVRALEESQRIQAKQHEELRALLMSEPDEVKQDCKCLIM